MRSMKQLIICMNCILILPIAIFVVLPFLTTLISDRSGSVLDQTQPRKVCPVHGTTLKEQVLPISYGYPSFLLDPKYRKVYEEESEARKAEFPCANSWYHTGGCNPPPAGEATKVKLSYCPDCRRAEAAWDAAHNNLMRELGRR